MSDTFDAIDWEAQITANDKIDGYNGRTIPVDIRTLTTFVADSSISVITTNNQVSLRHTISRLIYSAKDDPSTVLTRDQFNSIQDQIGIIVAKHVILSVAHAAKLDMVLRNSDTVSVASFMTELSNTDGQHICLSEADKIIVALAKSKKRAAKVLKQSRLVLLSIIAVGLHRHANDGHSWLSNDTHNSNTTTGKITRVAGRESEEFRTWMKDHGHDVWHMLNDASLNRLADAVTGIEEVRIVNSVKYDGKDVKDMFLHNVLSVGEAASDRWPPNLIGLSAIILGLSLMTSMLADIAARITISNVRSITNNIESVANAVRDTNMDRETLLELRATLSGSIVFAYGYSQKDIVSSANRPNHASLENLAKSFTSDFASGGSLFELVSSLEVDPTALGDYLGSMISTFATNLSDAAKAFDGLVLHDVPNEKIVIKPSSEERRSEEAKQSNDMMKQFMLLSMGNINNDNE